MERISGGELTERLPQVLLLDILSMLDVESLCSTAPVCRALRSSVSQVLSSIPNLDLSICYRLPHFRILSLELVCGDGPHFTPKCKKSIEKMFKRCLHLESLSIKFHTPFHLHGGFDNIQLVLPKPLKTLLLQPIKNWQAAELILSNQLSIDKNLPSTIDVQPSCLMLQSLTLILDLITDRLILIITNYLHYLTVLCLEDNLWTKPAPHNDLTNAGLELLSSSKRLTCLALSRSRPNVFGRITDVGILVLAEGCTRLESIRLEGFSKVTDAGYISILQSFKTLKRFEVINGYLLSDLAFHGLTFVSTSLVEVVLISCNLLTSEAAESLSLCKNLEMLDLGGCKSIADHGLNSISMLNKLTLLDLSGADITDSSLSALGLGRSPIATLCLRGCRRIGDRGFRKLFKKDSVIVGTLSKLDLGYLPGVTDETIALIVRMCSEISSLCIRHCFFVSDGSIRALGLMPDFEGKRRLIKRLDIYKCSRLSADSIEFFSRPYFRGLRWLGFGNTRLHGKEGGRMEELLRERPLMSSCVYGCEMGCKDGWFLH
ncbi:F-box protein At-B isoform X2 [Phalaenopsis equestris]|uniref:F-box protein At-B isoform X2 n=1 Tax=Phalaenopsis equestris TaxID=78828 RepID=UPI0009E1A281|nr:F-box protein At-B isoform X2 [Phalaenopsis equestris]